MPKGLYNGQKSKNQRCSSHRYTDLRLGTKGDMLGRSRLQVYTALRDFVVIEEDEQIIACGALHIVWDDIAEIRSLAVNPEHLRKGYGRQLSIFYSGMHGNWNAPKYSR